MFIDRNSTTVVGNGNRPIVIDDNIQFIAVAFHGLINGVIHNLIDQVMKSALSCISNIHCWTFADGLQSFENLNIFRLVI